MGIKVSTNDIVTQEITQSLAAISGDIELVADEIVNGNFGRVSGSVEDGSLTSVSDFVALIGSGALGQAVGPDGAGDLRLFTPGTGSVTAEVGTGFYVVNTLAALKALTASSDPAIVAGDSIVVRYRATAGDGGGGLFRVLAGTAAANSMTADDGVVVQNDAGNFTFRREQIDYIDVRWYGVKGDGTGSATNHTYLQAALTASTYGSYPLRRVLIPAGMNIVLTGSITVPNYCVVEGAGAKLIKNFNGDVISGVGYEATIRGLKIDGEGATYTGGGILINSGSFQLLDDLTVVDTQLNPLRYEGDGAGLGSVVRGGVYSATSVSTYAIRWPYDVSGGNRELLHVHTDGYALLDARGADDGSIIGCNGFNVLLGALSRKLRIVGNRTGIIHSTAMTKFTVRGASNTISGNAFNCDVRFAGNEDASITAISATNPVVVTVASHTVQEGDPIQLLTVGGMTELDQDYYIAGPCTATTVEIYSHPDNTPLDGSSFTAYTSGGVLRLPGANQCGFDSSNIVPNSNTITDDATFGSNEIVHTEIQTRLYGQKASTNPALLLGKSGYNYAHLGFVVSTGATEYEIQADNGAIYYEATGTRDHYFRTNSIARLIVDGSGVVTPGADNTQSFGTASLRWSEIFAGNGTINTSDAREKTAIAALSAAELAAAKRISTQLGSYQWLASVAAKGADLARHHFGTTAQTVRDSFIAEGLDPTKYGIFCADALTEIVVKPLEDWTPQDTEHYNSTRIPPREPVPLNEWTQDHFDGFASSYTLPLREKKAGTWTAQEMADFEASGTKPTIKRAVLDDNGDPVIRYGVRYDQLSVFLIAAIEQRLAALEV